MTFCGNLYYCVVAVTRDDVVCVLRVAMLRVVCSVKARCSFWLVHYRTLSSGFKKYRCRMISRQIQWSNHAPHICSGALKEAPDFLAWPITALQFEASAAVELDAVVVLAVQVTCHPDPTDVPPPEIIMVAWTVLPLGGSLEVVVQHRLTPFCLLLCADFGIACTYTMCEVFRTLVRTFLLVRS